MIDQQTVNAPARPAVQQKWLFHTKEFQSLHATKGVFRTYYQYREEQVLASLRCILQDNVATASSAGPFGCMELDPDAAVSDFLQYVTDDLASKNVRQLSLTLFPEVYDPVSFERQQKACMTFDFKREGTISHRLVPVTHEDSEPLANNDWRARGNTISEFRVTQEPLQQYPKIMQLLGKNTQGELSATTNAYINHFPGETLLFAVRDGAKFCALAVVVRMGPGVLYTVQLEQLDDYENRDPLVSAFQFLYEWAELNGMRWIDLGEVSLNLHHKIGTILSNGERWVRKWS
jgi:hypothetical protein